MTVRVLASDSSDSNSSTSTLTLPQCYPPSPLPTLTNVYSAAEERLVCVRVCVFLLSVPSRSTPKLKEAATKRAEAKKSSSSRKRFSIARLPLLLRYPSLSATTHNCTTARERERERVALRNPTN